MGVLATGSAHAKSENSKNSGVADFFLIRIIIFLLVREGVTSKKIILIGIFQLGLVGWVDRALLFQLKKFRK